MNDRAYITENRIDFLDILNILTKKIQWLILTGILCAGIMWAIAVFLVPAQYEARITMYVYNNPDLINQNSITTADLQASEDLAETYIQILQSNRVLDSVVDALDSENRPSRSALKKMLTVKTVKGTQLLRLSVTSRDAELSYELANIFAESGPDEITRITKVGNAEIVDYALMPEKPVSPNILRYAFSGFFGGLLLAALYYLFQAWTDYTLYIPENIEKASGLIVLGQIPEFEGRKTPEEYKELLLRGNIVYEQKK